MCYHQVIKEHFEITFIAGINIHISILIDLDRVIDENLIDAVKRNALTRLFPAFPIIIIKLSGQLN